MDDPTASTTGLYKAEYASTGRAKCHYCKETITEGAFRVGPELYVLVYMRPRRAVCSTAFPNNKQEIATVAPRLCSLVSCMSSYRVFVPDMPINSSTSATKMQA